MTLGNVCSENVLPGERFKVDFPTLLDDIPYAYILPYFIAYKRVFYIFKFSFFQVSLICLF